MIEAAAFGIYDVTSWNANVTLEYGIARGLGTKAFIAFNPDRTDVAEVPSDVRGYDRLQYAELDELSSAIEDLVVNDLGTGGDICRSRRGRSAPSFCSHQGALRPHHKAACRTDWTAQGLRPASRPPQLG
jgi:hypothetical protein